MLFLFLYVLINFGICVKRLVCFYLVYMLCGHISILEFCTTSGIIVENYKEIFNINDIYFVSFEIDKKIVQIFDEIITLFFQIVVLSYVVGNLFNDFLFLQSIRILIHFLIIFIKIIIFLLQKNLKGFFYFATSYFCSRITARLSCKIIRHIMNDYYFSNDIFYFKFIKKNTHITVSIVFK